MNRIALISKRKQVLARKYDDMIVEEFDAVFGPLALGGGESGMNQNITLYPPPTICPRMRIDFDNE